MARPNKQGLSYYNLDTDVFSNRKIRRLLKNFGSNGYLIYSYVLTEIYRDKGYFIVWDEDTVFDVSDYLNLKETLVSEVINYCCAVGLFNKALLTSEKILTSKNIQEFWVSVSKKAKRKEVAIKKIYDLIHEETLQNEEETPKKREETPLNEEESTQSKRKESKEKKEEEVKKETPPTSIFESNSLHPVKTLKNELLKNKRKYEAMINHKPNKFKDFKHLKTRLNDFEKSLSGGGTLVKEGTDFCKHFRSWHLKTLQKQGVTSDDTDRFYKKIPKV